MKYPTILNLTFAFLVFVGTPEKLFAQNDTLKHIPNLYFTKNGKKVKKINSKSPITFVTNIENGNFVTKVVTIGFVKKIIDSSKIEILPISKMNEHYKKGKIVESFSHNYIDSSFAQTEIIEIFDLKCLSYQSNRNKKSRKNSIIIAGISVITAITMLISLKLDKDLKDETNDYEIKIGKASVGLALLSLQSLIALRPKTFDINPSGNEKSKKKLYRLEQLK